MLLNIVKQEKIHLAASWMSADENDLFGDPKYKAFCHMMEHRRELALKCIEASNLEEKEAAYAVFEHCNNELKKILGL